jgi:hypothetical protein
MFELQKIEQENSEFSNTSYEITAKESGASLLVSNLSKDLLEKS